MLTYHIELETERTVRLIKDTNPTAARPYDGGQIHHAPEQYPATICDFSYGDPAYPDGADPAFAMPISYPTEMLNYRETIVNNADEWQDVAAARVRGDFAA